MSKAVLFNSVEFAMIQELAKKTRQKPEQYLKTLIKSQYDNLKR